MQRMRDFLQRVFCENSILVRGITMVVLFHEEAIKITSSSYPHTGVETDFDNTLIDRFEDDIKTGKSPEIQISLAR